MTCAMRLSILYGILLSGVFTVLKGGRCLYRAGDSGSMTMDTPKIVFLLPQAMR